MRNLLNIIIPLLMLGQVLVSCQEKEVPETRGYLSLHTCLDKSEDLVFTKAGEAQNEIFSMRILNSKNETVAEYSDISVLASEPVSLLVGHYTAEVYSADSSPAAYDNPEYAGSQAFTIATNEVNALNVTCSMSNIKVTAAFDEKIRNGFSEYTLTVDNGLGTLEYSNLTDTHNREGFFSVTDHLTWTLSLKNNDGKTYTATDTYTGIKPKQHYNLSFTVKDRVPFGGGSFEIILDDSFNENEYQVDLDFGAKFYPSITSEIFEMTATNTIFEGQATDGRFMIHSSNGLRSIKLVHANQNLTDKGLQLENEFIGIGQSLVEAYKVSGIDVPSSATGVQDIVLDFSRFFTGLPAGEYSMTFKIYDVQGHSKFQDFVFVVKSAAAVAVNKITSWAKYATVEGVWFTTVQPEGLGFRYKAENAVEWTEIGGDNIIVNSADKKFTAQINGLVVNTSYQLKAVTATDKNTKERIFTTDATAGTIPYLNFDSWCKDGKHWRPNKNVNEHIWDTANEGANMIKELNPTSPELSLVAVKGEGKKAARLESMVVVGNFAAGNIYTGDFGKASINPVGATLQWGVPFESRPYALKGYYNYKPKPISHASGKYAHLKGKTDEMMIQVLLTDWGAPFQINTGEARFVDMENDPHIIAYGSLAYGAATDGYVEFSIPLEYRDTQRKPTHIVVVAAASRYGDFFTGGQGSVLYVDEFSFVYDPAELLPAK